MLADLVDRTRRVRLLTWLARLLCCLPSHAPVAPYAPFTSRDVSREEAAAILASLHDELESLHGHLQRMVREHECKICFDARTEVILLPCGHALSCRPCSELLDTCPVCGAAIEGRTGLFCP